MTRGAGLARRGLRIAAGLAALAVLAGCVRIPMAGEVATAPIAIDDQGDTLLPVPEGPAAGATPREIIAGFLRAGRGPQNLYAVAREFLTDDFAAEWRPSAGVLVSASPVVPAERDEGGYRVELEVAAELDAGGRYELAPDDSTRSLDFELVEVDGEWRISAAPDGTVLTPAFFETIFEPVELYYYSPDFRFLVPELRWFLDTRTIANRIVDELIAGESPLLDAGVLVTAFPSGSDRLEPVDIDAGRATVTLSAELLAESRTAQWRMLQQLVASVGSLNEVNSISIVSGGFPVDITEAGGTPDRFLQVDPIPVGLLDGRFGSLRDGAVEPLDALGTAADGIGARAASLDRDRDTLAVLTTTGVSRVSAEGEQAVSPGADRIAPTIDPWGYIWTGPRTDLGGLQAIAADGAISSMGLGVAGRVTALELSRDGTRLLVAVSTSDGPRVMVMGVVRGDDQVPEALVEPVLLEVTAETVVDAAWIDGATVAILARTGATTSVQTLTLGGRVSGLGALDDAEQLVGGNGVEGIRVRTADGRVFRPSGESNWLDTGLRASFLASQQ